MAFPKRTLAMQLWTFTDRFIRERRTLHNVSPATAEWYHYSLKAFRPVLEVDVESTAELRAAVVSRIEQLREQGRGNKAVSVNTYLRCLKAFLNWCQGERILQEPVKLNWLKEEQKILPTFLPDHIRRFIDWKPATRSGARLRTIILTALDTGMRLNELLSLLREDLDFDNFRLRVKGKGGRERLIPMSIELRRILYRHTAKNAIAQRTASPGLRMPQLVFCTIQGRQLSKRNLLRDFKEAAGALGITGIRCSLHTCRHTFAVNYLRAGGNLYYLQRILGHSSISTTERYLRSLGIEDLQKVHDGLSLIASGHGK